MDKATDADGHPSKYSNDRIDVENMDVDEPNMIHDSSETKDVNPKQTESMVDDDVEQMMYPQILIKAYNKKLSVMMLRLKKQIRQMMLLDMIVQIVMIE